MKPSRCGRISHHLHVTARIEMTSHDLSMRRVLPLWATAATTVSKKSQLPFKESQFSSLTLPPMKRQDVQHWLIGVEIQDSPKRREISPSEASDFQDRPLSTDDLEMLSSPSNSGSRTFRRSTQCQSGRSPRTLYNELPGSDGAFHLFRTTAA